MNHPRAKHVWKYSALAAVSLLSLWPLTRVNPIADDLHLLAQGSGLLRQDGFGRVLGQWTEFDLASAHLTPVGGLLTALHVWVANQLSLRTSLTLDDAWGLLRVLWIVLAILATVWAADRLLRVAGLPSPGHWTVALSLIASLQVHAYWSNDPVVAFPVAPWAFCIIGLLYLGMTIEYLDSQSSNRVWWGIGAFVMSFIGIFTYELFIAFIAASVVLHAGFLVLRVGRVRHVLASFVLGALLPGSLLLVTQLIRLAGGSSYSGTDIATGTRNLPWIAVVAFLSSLPFTALKLTMTVLPTRSVGLSTFLFPILGIVSLAAISLKRERLPRDISGSNSKMILATVSALTTLWLASTLVIIATPKYQGELAGVLGRVYVNYAPGWIAVGLLLIVTIGVIGKRFGNLGIRASVLFVVLMGATQAWSNGIQIDTLTRDSSWSTPLLRNLESLPSENERRCRDADFLFSLPLPEYYQVEILDGLQKSYSGTWGLPFCDFNQENSAVRLLMRGIVGTYPIEHLPEGRRVVWTMGSEVRLQFINSSDVPVRGEMEFLLSIPACVSERIVTVSGEAVQLNSAEKKLAMNVTSPNARMSIPVALAPTEGVTIELSQSGSGCHVGSDPRELWTMIEFSSIKKP